VRSVSAKRPGCAVTRAGRGTTAMNAESRVGSCAAAGAAAGAGSWAAAGRAANAAAHAASTANTLVLIAPPVRGYGGRDPPPRASARAGSW
jgi:hypothetical protein